MIPEREPFDPTLDALLRTHSDEAPSPDVDAAILAAAHRAVQSGPRRAARPAEATSPWRWWMPLAAAAVIGAIAIGVLQLIPKATEPTTSTIVSDTPPGARAVAESPARAVPEAAAPPPAAAPIAKDRTEPLRAEKGAPRAKVRADRPAPAPAAKNEVERGAAPEPFPAQSRDAMEQGNAAGALAHREAAQAAAPAVAKQSAAAADASATAPEQRIARIRALLNEGKVEDAARELVAFRAAYPDADARLPADLHAWAATIRR